MVLDGPSRENRDGEGDANLQDQQNQEEPLKSQYWHLKRNNSWHTTQLSDPVQERVTVRGTFENGPQLTSIKMIVTEIDY